jgi:hypothetical protein
MSWVSAWLLMGGIDSLLPHNKRLKLTVALHKYLRPRSLSVALDGLIEEIQFEQEKFILVGTFKLKNIFKAVLFLFILGGCATSTPYEKSGFGGGYTDFETQPGIYYVSFQGNAYTSKETVIRFWHERAAEICGGTYRYEIVSQGNSSTQHILGDANDINTVHKSRAEGYIKCKK